MTSLNDLIIRDAVRKYGADGILQSNPAEVNYGNPDGYLSAAELQATRERVLSTFATWRENNQFKTAPIMVQKEHGRVMRLVKVIDEMIPKAEEAEAAGKPGVAYMGSSFYDLVAAHGLSSEHIAIALQSDSDLNGEVTFREVDTYLWFAGQELINIDQYYPSTVREQLLDALRPAQQEGRVTGFSLRR